MKKWILSITCLLAVGTQVCLGAEKAERKKPLMVKVKVKEGKETRAHMTPHPTRDVKKFSYLASINKAVAEQLVSDVEPKVQTAPSEEFTEKPRAKLHASAVLPLDFKDGKLHNRTESLTMWRGSEGEEALSAEFAAVSVSDISPSRATQATAWGSVKLRAASVSAALASDDTDAISKESQKKADDLKRELTDYRAGRYSVTAHDTSA